MRKIKLITLITIITGMNLLAPGVFLAQEATEPQQAERPSLQLTSPSPEAVEYAKTHRQQAQLVQKKAELSVQKQEELKNSIKAEVIEKLLRLYNYEPGTIILEFYDRKIPDKMALRGDAIKTGEPRLDAFLQEQGFNEFQIVGSSFTRKKLDLGAYRFAYVSSPRLKDEAKAFLRVTNRKLNKLMQDFAIELYMDKPYHDMVSFNLKNAYEYLKDKDISFKLWNKEIAFKFQDRQNDPFSLEIIEELKGLSVIKGAYITPIYYPATDYYAENQMWNLNYSLGGSYFTYDAFLDMVISFGYTNNQKYDEDIDAKVVWDNPALYDPSNGGNGAIVALIDSGVDFTHPELTEQLWVNDGEDLNHNGIVELSDFNNIDDDDNGYVDDVSGFNFFNAEHLPGGPWINNNYTSPLFSQNNIPACQPFDDYAHGTAMASIIVAKNDNEGIKGIAYNSKILPLKDSNEEGLSFFTVRDNAFEYAILMESSGVNIKVITYMSTGYFYDPTLSNLIVNAWNHDITVVAPVGNDFPQPIEPGINYYLNQEAVDKAIIVGASNVNGNVCSFSNYGSNLVDVVAPGDDIISALLQYVLPELNLLIPESNDELFIMSGTCPAAAHVAGLAALFGATYPSWSAQQIQFHIATTAETLIQDNLLAPWPETHQGNGKINMSGIPNIQIPQFTSNPVTMAFIPEQYIYQAEASGVIDPWFDWPMGYEPPYGMQLDKGIGLITWTPSANPPNNQFGETYTIRLLAKNYLEGHVEHGVEQSFDVIVGASEDPGDYVNLPQPNPSPPGSEDTYYPDAESYIIEAGVSSPLVGGLPTSIPSGTGVCMTGGINGYAPAWGVGLLVNGQPLYGNTGAAFSEIEQAYVPYFLVYPPPIPPSIYPTWDTGISGPIILEYQTGWSYGMFPSVTPYELGIPFGEWDDVSREGLVHRFLFANPTDVQAIYGNNWEVEMGIRYYGQVTIAAANSVPIQTRGGRYYYYDPQYVGEVISFHVQGAMLLPLGEIEWQGDEGQPEPIPFRPRFTIYYTNNKTGELEPLKNTKIELFGIHSVPPPEQFYWTDDEGYFDLGYEAYYESGYSPFLVIHAQCRDGEHSNIIADVWKYVPTMLYASTPIELIQSPQIINLRQEGEESYYFNHLANILMEIRKAYDFLNYNTDLNSPGLGEPPLGEGQQPPFIPIRPDIHCTYMGVGNSVYNSGTDTIDFGAEYPSNPILGPTWYEIRHNYALSVLQYQLESIGVLEIGCDGGAQDFEIDSSWQTAFTWGFADLVALRADGESQTTINYSQDYNIELTDFENQAFFPEISDPTLSEGVCAGIFLDMVDTNYDTADELRGSMFGQVVGPESTFNYIFHNMLNTALTAVALPNHEFNLVDFHLNWWNYGYPDFEKVNGIYLGHGINIEPYENP